MTIYIDAHDCHYEVQRLCTMFLRGERAPLAFGAPGEGEERFLYTGRAERDGKALLTVRARLGGSEVHRQRELPLPSGKQECERAFGQMIYELLVPMTGIRPPWGILTGIRPVKLFRARLDAGESGQEVLRYFCDGLYLSEEKARLALQTAQVQRPILRGSAPDLFSLYVSIPFCPSRCRYCSFVSHSIEQAAGLIEPYLELLERELALTAQKARESSLRLHSVYFGGGTPTTLSAAQLDRLCAAVAENFDLGGVKEYTVEAGRPDTITAEKLAVLRKAGVDRISVNPQTLQDEVLAAAGRNHTAQQTLDAFGLARQAGFPCINMDLIAGLQGDTPQGFADTLERVIALRPQNITVHALSVKRSAALGGHAGEVLIASPAAEMVALSARLLIGAGYHPYYLYRQKDTVENLENTGWCLPGYESAYNIHIMDESQTILACGAGGVTKLCRPKGTGGQEITRIFNYKYPYEYISRFEQLCARKEAVVPFFAGMEKN
ncbi:coproporphyrinogen dehydrogenase HemZ [Harryflintia acetispora]|uniref:Oxygen-independent coproporphyrinogen-3 oxidase n=1 Tax=Harryflintia acetispora TaxID=1849041 RepID=A0A9X8UIL5_9FIRM|nr:coproporphyrinogen dehydrogenase HemZ [Harryflintia acetispora]TCL42925.1 oxygen-independent coproporphyrinogen-3 oxidase [Harryflintia acetispora]